MLEFIKLLAGTVILRPYVFLFFACYLFLAITSIGGKRTFLFTTLAYSIAFICEWSSVHFGFPFGLYYYIPTTVHKELWIAGIPFMDSLSFTFLTYISYEMAILLRSPLIVNNYNVQALTSEKIRCSYGTTILASLLMMYLDIAIDPVALKGDKWFLGKIYYYPNGGSYFGITIANFIGWFFICGLILRTFLVLEKYIEKTKISKTLNYKFKSLAPAFLYFGVLLFNITITFIIKETTIGWASAFIGGLLLMLLINHITYCKTQSISS